MRRIALFLSVATVVAMMVAIVAPAAGLAAIQEDTSKDKQKEDTSKDQMKEDTSKDKAKDDSKDKEMPKTGGVSTGDAALIGLGATALLIGGGLVVRRATR